MSEVSARSEPLPSATVIVLRDGSSGPQVFLVRRHDDSPFMPGAHVFPGGRLEAGETPVEAGVRELFEEAGICVDAAALVPFSQWRTPAFEGRRFDTRFFLARMPTGRTPVLDTRETSGGGWFDPSDALDRCRRREMLLPLPTWTTLRELEPFSTVDDALSWASTRTIVVREPRIVVRGDRRLLVLPGDPLNDDTWPEGAPVDGRFEFDGDRWMPVARTEQI